MAVPYTQGTLVWMPDGTGGWRTGTVTSSTISSSDPPVAHITISSDSDLDVTTTIQTPLSALQNAKADRTQADFQQSSDLPPLRNPPALEMVEDLAALSNLNEPSVLHAIATRYLQHMPYTYSGIVLLSVNPFTPLNIYDGTFINLYLGQKKEEQDPHVFAIAEEALNHMRRGTGEGGVDPSGAGDQTVIVSGESGAGKTVAAKYIMRYFASAHMGTTDPLLPRKSGHGEEGMSEIEKQILASNPIMEAFGNAKTTRNDNSSRFGKYIQVLFSHDQQIVGARVRTYLLERSRLTYQPPSERNYHVFYQLIAGAPAKERKDLSLPDSPLKFAYLSGGGTSSYLIHGVDDAQEFDATQRALSMVGISVERQWHIFKLLAALLHLGDVQISQSRSDAHVVDDDSALILTSDLMGLPLPDFKRWIVKKQLITRNEKITTNLTCNQAIVVRDSVAKFIYSCLFQWLVSVVNASLAGDVTNDIGPAKKFIGVLDIYGFEHFAKNSFEQFCINWANEKLQQQFNAHVFKLEQEEYVREEIDWTFIDFTDNQACIDVIEGRMGILALLDEESRLPSGSDQSFANKIHHEFAKAEHQKVFKKPRFNNNAFTVAHYAHDVTYDTEGFVEKNRDTVPDEHLHLLQSSTNEFVREMVFTATEAAVGDQQAKTVESSTAKRGTPRKPTLGSMFKASLVDLMATINDTNVHYIRCIKPNEKKAAWEFDSAQVLGQLRACGVLETIRISCAGFPSRWTYTQFADRYHIMLHTNQWHSEMDVKELCRLILEKTLENEDDYQLGLSKIFFRSGILAFLESRRAATQFQLAATLQKHIRRYLARRQYTNWRKSAVSIQAWWRGTATRRVLEVQKQETAALLLQTIVRCALATNRLKHARKAVIDLQSALRQFLAKRKREQMQAEKSAVFVQRLCRGALVAGRYRQTLCRVILLQSLWRRRLAIRELASLKREAKSAKKFKEISYQLENKVVELTQTLQKRNAEHKEICARLKGLEDDHKTVTHKNESLSARNRALEEQMASLTVPKEQFDDLAKEKKDLEVRLNELVLRSGALETQLQEATRQLESTSKRSPVQLGSKTEDADTISQLRAELNHVREQLSRNDTFNALNGRAHPNTFTSPRSFSLRQLDNVSSAPSLHGISDHRRRNRRHSMVSKLHAATDGDAEDKPLVNTRALSAAYTPDVIQRSRDSQGLPVLFTPGNVQQHIVRLLEDLPSLDNEVLQGLIYQLKIPSPSLHTPLTAKEILFPAHLISLITNEMWKLAMVTESETFLANVMQAIQEHVLAFKGEDAICPGVFWLSNVQEILSFVCIAEDDASKGIAPEGSALHDDKLNWDDYTRLIGVVKHDLDSLEYNIYHTLMLESKKKLSKMVIPAVIESQSLPGFVTSDGSGRMLSRMLGGIGGVGAPQPVSSMDDILNLLNRVWKCLKSYFMEESVMHQVVTELLKLIGQISFNDLVMRRNFSSWKRAMQIQYNITRIEEWCKSHDMPEGLLQLEHLMQATKLLQLKKATLGDIDILFDVCWILSPTQVQKLISQYHTADYEVPLNSEILRAVAARVKPEDKSDQLLLAPEADEVGPYQLPPPRDIVGLETYVPAFLNVPNIRQLATFVA
ncbi:hypothetical protein L202_06517 [Cryptococcus amylolentus CBS 6039]|uniref:Myosin motor domain-containing protein n=1 Tax=Cryptococcus amylolentus CBS 6039 TaxID=1295533 RepID=A0A1E3HIV0_9TREE|nr:hypothetical protein L202_06517 [Cryptococcus amylolentus CBS 6039]ODN75341.1 hypothetical protein L202_06517 [Cryptococcus amylolentus CBS 6039]